MTATEAFTRKPVQLRRDLIKLRKQRDELLEACEKMMHWFGRYPEFLPAPDYSRKRERDIEFARAAIAKAEKGK